MVSHVRAAESGVYVASIHSQNRDLSPKLMLPLVGIRHGFEVRSLLGWLQEYERGWQQMQALFSQCAQDCSNFRWLSLTYEDDLVQSPLDGYQRVCSFLGLSALANLRYHKLNPGSLSELIANWDEIRALLTQSHSLGCWKIDSVQRRMAIVLPLSERRRNPVSCTPSGIGSFNCRYSPAFAQR